MDVKPANLFSMRLGGTLLILGRHYSSMCERWGFCFFKKKSEKSEKHTTTLEFLPEDRPTTATPTLDD